LLFWKCFYFISPTVAFLREPGVIMTLNLLAIDDDREYQTRIAVRSTAEELRVSGGQFMARLTTRVIEGTAGDIVPTIDPAEGDTLLMTQPITPQAPSPRRKAPPRCSRRASSR
jgi:hypothetical protein